MIQIQLLVIVLNDRDRERDLLKELAEAGAGGATLLESCGLGRDLTTRIPYFGGLRHTRSTLLTPNIVVFSLIRKEEVLREAQRRVLDMMEDFRETGSGMMFTLPVGQVWGGAREGGLKKDGDGKDT